MVVRNKLVPLARAKNIYKAYNVGWFKWSFFRIFEINIFCFVVAIFDLVHNVEAIRGMCDLLTSSGNLF